MSDDQLIQDRLLQDRLTKDRLTQDQLTQDRRGFLKCMTWAGSAMVWTMAGGVPRSRLIG